jgi:hypothetical protein
MAYYTPDGKGGMVPYDGDVPAEAITAIDKYDEDSIVRSMTSGVAAEEYIYRYTIQTARGSSEIIGISSTGADQLANLMGNLEVLNDVRLDKDSDSDYIYAMLRIRNLERNTTLLGVGRACKYMVGRGNEPQRDRLDEHAFVKSISKAQRNGILHHASADVVAAIIAKWAKEGKQARIGPPSVSTSTKSASQPKQQETKPPVEQKSDQSGDKKPGQDEIAKQMEKLTGLQKQIKDLFANRDITDENQVMQVINLRYSVDKGLMSLNENQLNDCIEYLRQTAKKDSQSVEKTTTQPPETTTKMITWESLGFESAEEQTSLRSRIFNLLTNEANLGMTTDQAKKWVKDNYELDSTTTATKQTIEAMIKSALNTIEVIKSGGQQEQLI